MAPGPPPVATRKPGLAQRTPQFRRLGVLRTPPRRRMPAHDAHHGRSRRGQELIEGVGNGVVVHGRGKGGVQCWRVAGLDAPLVDPGVRDALVLLRDNAFEQLGAGVQVPAVGVEGDVRQGGEDQGTAAAQQILHARGKGAAHENGPRGPQLHQFGRPPAQVHRLEMPPVHGFGAAGHQRVKAVQLFNFNVAGAAAQGAGSRTKPSGRGAPGDAERAWGGRDGASGRGAPGGGGLGRPVGAGA